MKKAVIACALSILALPFAVRAETETNVRVKADVRAEIGGKPPRPMPPEKTEAAREDASTTRQEIKANIMERSIELKEKASTTRAEVRANIEARIQQFIENAGKYLGDAVARLTAIKDKIADRVEALEEDGKDMAEAKAKLSVAEDKLAEADASVSLVADVEISTSTPRESIESLKSAIGKAREAIRAAHEALVDIVRTLKPGQAKVETNATTSVSN